MTDPYRPPDSNDSSTPKLDKPGYSAPVIGCVSGGCLLPILLFFVCAFFLGDTGGPLFWPFIAVPLGILGLIFGFVYRSVKS